MKFLTYARSLHDLNLIKSQNQKEVILEHQALSRLGKLDSTQFVDLAHRARELNLRVLLEWDILMTENVFMESVKILPEILDSVDAVRVQDPGAFEWMLTHSPLPIQFIAENGNHNEKALQGWIDHGKGRVERMILSIELNRDVLSTLLKKLTVPCELLGFGRILLFYTPRALLSPLQGETLALNDELTALGESEESPHKGFPVVENRHGTFMFHIKEFCLVDYLEDLKTLGLDTFRVDLRVEGLKYLELMTQPEALKAAYPHDLMRGFYLVNKTDVLFPKLKNHRLQKRDNLYVGEVMEAEKGSHLAIIVKNPKGLQKNQKIKILHPKGEVFEVEVRNLKDLGFEDVESVEQNKLAIIPFLGGVWVKSQVFYA
jgi:U32 family peptidase